ncbi:MAG: phosphatidate cytidylyltransferase [Rickettsiales bacterium]|jgi:phosphatidate cytidylyltransferase|nr:phosphatidate cytidylyltransferase [Rickettsiales bacterium]
MSGLRKRALSSVVMVAAAAVAFAAGYPLVCDLCIVMAGVMSFEYSRMFSPGKKISPRVVWDAVSVPAVLLLFGMRILTAGQSAAALFVLFGLSAALSVLFSREHPVLGSLAPVYVGLGVLSMLHIYSAFGGHFLLYLLSITVSADVGGFFVGSALGGPKLAPSISPNKTVSGAFGGLVFAFTFGTWVMIFRLFRLSLDDSRSVCMWGLISAFLGVVSILGDLFESRAKRVAGVKDASALIPGHGGFLDRFDSLLAVSAAFALLSLGGGLSSIGLVHI